MKTRGIFYSLAKILGDIGAIQKNKTGRRIKRRAAGKIVGRLLRKIK